MTLQDFLQAQQLIFCHLVAGDDNLFAAPEAVLVFGVKDETHWVITHEDTEQIELLRLFAAAEERVFIFEHAQSHMRRLLHWNIHVSRPICQNVIHRLLELSPPSGEAFRSTQEAQRHMESSRQTFSQSQEALHSSPYKNVARLECLASSAFAHMEYRGLYVDQQVWRNILKDEEEKKAAAESEFFSAAKPHVKIDLFGRPDISLEQDEALRELFEKLTGESLNRLDKKTLRGLEHPAAKALIKYRESAKLVSTYGEGFLQNIHASTGRIHAHFNPLGTSTGRVSCHSPNIQNLPTDERFHQAICAPPNKCLVTADYATCELRVLAALSGDKSFLGAFEKDEDLHSRVASEMFQTSVSKHENAHLRQRAKAINFGLIYGMGHRALARQVGVGEDEAKILLKQYFDAYPGIASFLEHSVSKAKSNGFAATVLNRRLYLEPSDNQLSRIAKNMPIQGTSAEIAKLAMARLNERLWRDHPDAFLVNMIHDELVVECPKEDGETIGQIVVEEMEKAQRTLLPSVKPKADVHVGHTWGH